MFIVYLFHMFCFSFMYTLKFCSQCFFCLYRNAYVLINVKVLLKYIVYIYQFLYIIYICILEENDLRNYEESFCQNENYASYVCLFLFLKFSITYLHSISFIE